MELTLKRDKGLLYRSEEEHAEYASVLTEALIPHLNGFVNWPTMDMSNAPDISNHGGIPDFRFL